RGPGGQGTRGPEGQIRVPSGPPRLGALADGPGPGGFWRPVAVRGGVFVHDSLARRDRPIPESHCTGVDFLPINGSNPRIWRHLHRRQGTRATMSKMTICLWFDRGKAREAAEFYASVFPDSHVGKAHASAVDIPSAKVGEDLTVEFTVLGQS